MVNNTMTLHCTYHDALHDAHARKLCSQLLNLPLPALHYGNVYIITIMLSHLAQIYNISTYELTHCFPLPVPLRSCQALPQAEHPEQDARRRQSCRLCHSRTRIFDRRGPRACRSKSLYGYHFSLFPCITTLSPLPPPPPPLPPLLAFQVFISQVFISIEMR